MADSELIVTKSDYTDWKKHPVTVQLLNVFTENKEYLKDRILALDPLSEENIERKLAYYSGSLHLCIEFLETKFEDLFSIEEERAENDDSKTPYFW